MENPVALSAEMALRIPANFRWCVTGTPIGRRGLNDLYGLFKFLQLKPFCNIRNWKEFIECGSRTGSKLEENKELLEVLRRVMWRHSAKQVQSELKIPEFSKKDVFFFAKPKNPHFSKKRFALLEKCIFDFVDIPLCF